jgi:hypothetical protein
MIEPHLAYLLKNQDNAMLVIQTNLASCQSELSYAEHNKEGHATPMKNIVPEFKGRKRNAHGTPAAVSPKPAEPKGAGAEKPAPNPPPNTPKKP